MIRFAATLERIQYGYWGQTPIKSKTIVIKAATKEAAEEEARTRAANLPATKLRNGDNTYWTFVSVCQEA